jgi:hypothetical protein
LKPKSFLKPNAALVAMGALEDEAMGRRHFEHYAVSADTGYHAAAVLDLQTD